MIVPRSPRCVALGLLLTCQLIGCHDLGSARKAVESSDSGVWVDAGMADAATDYVAMVEGVPCERFRAGPQKPACTDRTLKAACDDFRDAGLECPSTIGDPRDWACPHERTELVCNTCGGINVEQRYGFDGELAALSFSARGKLLGFILSGGQAHSEACMRPYVVDGDACPASDDRDARAAFNLCPRAR